MFSNDVRNVQQLHTSLQLLCIKMLLDKRITPPPERDLSYSLSDWITINRLLSTSQNPWRPIGLTDRGSFAAAALEIVDSDTVKIYLKMGGRVDHVIVKPCQDKIPFNAYRDQLARDTNAQPREKDYLNLCLRGIGEAFAVPFAYIVASGLLDWNLIQTDSGVLLVDLEHVRESMHE